MIYKNKIILLLHVIFCINILNVRSQRISVYSHINDTFDVTTIYRLTNSSLKPIKNKNARISDLNSLSMSNIDYSIEVHSRTNAIGMPLEHIKKKYYTLSQINVDEFFLEGNQFKNNNSRMNMSYTNDQWRKVQISLNGKVCDNSDDSIYMNSNLKCYDGLLFKIYEYYYFPSISNITVFTLYWTPDSEQSCLSITYVLKSISNSCINIIMKILDNNNNLITSTELKKYDEILTLKVTNLMKEEQYKLSLEIIISNQGQCIYNFNNFNNYNSVFRDYLRLLSFGLLRIAQFTNNDEDVRIIVPKANKKFNLIPNPTPFNILGKETTELSNDFIGSCLNGGFKRYSKCLCPPGYKGELCETETTELSNYGIGSCLNGGYTSIRYSKCICPPGFKGELCETGCGQNSYGIDCEAYCSMHDDKMCRGVYMCTGYGCICPPGLTGPFCNEDCVLGTYGADCKQICSSNCDNRVCDQYTGDCSHGCSPGYIQPFCEEKYPILVNAPELILTKCDSLEIKLNLKSDNIKGGNGNTIPTYYQLLYKPYGEELYKNSDIKLISQYNKSAEIIYNLEPYTTYSIGVLLITDDGNFNDQDIICGQYKTSCIDPQINTDYNMKLISGIKSINVTWNKIILNSRLECNITGYVLTVMINISGNQITNTQEILASSDSGHYIEDLLPGYQYNLKLTPMSVKGPLPSSPVYAITTLTQKNDAIIKNISATIEYGRIRVYWTLVNTHRHYSTSNDPVAYIIRYKLTRILSCSLKELEVKTYWTSITVYNQFSYEIFDTIPNSQYSVQVIIANEDINTIRKKNMIYVLTPALIPKTEPIIDFDRPISVTNKSAIVQWKIDPMSCSKLHGFFSNFYVELKDKDLNILKTDETKQNYIFFDDLRSNTSYELKVFIKTHNGYNPDHYLLTNFTTKCGYLKSVDDLMVYKKSLKNRMVGIRWSYDDNTNLNGFIVSFNENAFTNRQNYSVIPPIKCSAWPEFYCYTFYNLSSSNNYTFKIMPKSLDYPEGGQVSSIFFNSIDGLPDPPSNIQSIKISDTTINIQWDIPWTFNGLLKMFTINAEEVSAIDMDTCCSSVIPAEIVINEELPTYNYTLMGLKPGSTYSISILTVSKSLWYSSPATISITTLEEEFLES